MVDAARARRFFSRWWLTLAMLAAVTVVLGAAVWSAGAEREAAFLDFAHEQAALARSVGIDFENRLESRRAAGGQEPSMTDQQVLDLLAGARRLEERGKSMVMVARPGETGFMTTDHRVIPSERLREALARGDVTAVVPRDEAVAFGLPQRLAVAGLAKVPSGERAWAVVVLATAERLRDRRKHEAWRLGLTVVVVAGLGLGFGSVAQRRARRELALEQRVALSALERDREAALARADKMATVAALSTGIAHELGTPLSVIVGRVEQVRARVAEDPRADAALAVVLEQVARIRRIVGALLGLVRGDAPALTKVPARELAERAAGLVRHRFDNAEVDLVLTLPEGLPAVACEPSLFEQALINVLLNACQATAKGGRVVLSVTVQDGEAERVLFAVDDEGEGIPDEDARRAAEPFFSTKREHGGSGLGLTIAREIVAHHGGTLALARRRDGVGTRASIAVAV